MQEHTRFDRSIEIKMVQVSVKWGKESHNVDVDTSLPGLVFKNQLYSLTGVPPERQKIMVKGGMLKDDADLSKLNLKPNQKLMMMGTADKVRDSNSAAGKDRETDERKIGREQAKVLSWGTPLRLILAPVHKKKWWTVRWFRTD